MTVIGSRILMVAVTRVKGEVGWTSFTTGSLPDLSGLARESARVVEINTSVMSWYPIRGQPDRAGREHT
jgi:hypothetical protein